MISVLIPAAGSGERFGADDPKALVTVAGRPMLAWCVEVLSRVPGVGEILVAAPPSARAIFESVRTELGIAAWREIVEGGQTRSESVRNLLGEAEGSRVLVHDAARPCITTDWVTELLKELKDDAAGVPALPVRDTLKRGRYGLVTETVSRAGLYSVQTPQVFDTTLLRRAHAPEVEWTADPSDDAMLVEALGEDVRLLGGKTWNLKVTYPGDQALAEVIIGDRSR